MPVDEDGRWAVPSWQQPLGACSRCQSHWDPPVWLQAPAAQELVKMKHWVAGAEAEGSQDLAPGALSTAVQDEVFAGTGRNSRLSLGLVVLLLVFLNCR